MTFYKNKFFMNGFTVGSLFTMLTICSSQYHSNTKPVEFLGIKIDSNSVSKVVESVISDKYNKTKWISCISKRVNYDKIISGEIIPSKYTMSCGEDAYFNTGNIFGVADGVGGCKTKGAAREFATGLMYEAHKISFQEKNLNKMMDQAYQNNILNNKPGGSSTVCVASVENNQCSVLNLGDSGARIIRDGKVIAKTEETQHRWNYPYQLGQKDDGTEKDQIKDATFDQFKVKSGDYVVLATDGIYDNLSDDKLGEIIKNNKWNISDSIIKEACKMAVRENIEKNWKDGGHGGKEDDMTVIVKKVI